MPSQAPSASKRPTKGSHVVYGPGLQERWDVGPVTLWRWERASKIPAKDFFIGGKPVGWKIATIEAFEASSK